MEKLPSSIGNLVNLKHLDISNNQLSELPASVANMQALVKIDLTYNFFAKFTQVLLGLKNLQSLLIDNNPLNEALPSVKAFLQTIDYVDI